MFSERLACGWACVYILPSSYFCGCSIDFSSDSLLRSREFKIANNLPQFRISDTRSSSVLLPVGCESIKHNFCVQMFWRASIHSCFAIAGRVDVHGVCSGTAVYRSSTSQGRLVKTIVYSARMMRTWYVCMIVRQAYLDLEIWKMAESKRVILSFVWNISACRQGSGVEFSLRPREGHT